MTNGDRDPDQEREEMGREMTDRLASRFDDSGSTSEPQGDNDDLDSDPAETSNQSNESKPSKTSKTSKTDQASVKDRPSVLMYLPEDLHDDLDIRFDELNARYKREHGNALEKNRDYYPAVIEAGLEGKDLEEVLDL